MYIWTTRSLPLFPFFFPSTIPSSSFLYYERLQLFCALFLIHSSWPFPPPRSLPLFLSFFPFLRWPLFGHLGDTWENSPRRVVATVLYETPLKIRLPTSFRNREKYIRYNVTLTTHVRVLNRLLINAKWICFMSTYFTSHTFPSYVQALYGIRVWIGVMLYAGSVQGEKWRYRRINRRDYSILNKRSRLAGRFECTCLCMPPACSFPLAVI